MTEHRDGGGDAGWLALFLLYVHDARARKFAAEHWSCPFCAEPVRLRAVVCRFCGSDLPPPPPRRALSLRAALGLLGNGVLWTALVWLAAIAVMALTRNC